MNNHLNSQSYAAYLERAKTLSESNTPANEAVQDVYDAFRPNVDLNFVYLAIKEVYPLATDVLEKLEKHGTKAADIDKLFKELPEPVRIQIEEWMEEKSAQVKGGHPVELAKSSFAKLVKNTFQDDAISEIAQAKIDRLFGNFYPPSDEPGSDLATSWYVGPSPYDRRWWTLVEQLNVNSNMTQDDLHRLDAGTTRILSQLSSPGKPEFSSKGLVMGYVQSGKTTNFMGLVAKAADAGYRLIIVLSGTTNNLRNQTQARLESMLSPEYKGWTWLTQAEKDFKKQNQNANEFLTNPSMRVIAVVKKNGTILKSLYDWLDSADEFTRKNVPFLMIDDECDQATVNTAKATNAQTKINKLMTSILDSKFMAKGAYVGYSATPFANVLMDPAPDISLFPKDFIESLHKGLGYFGAEQLFGRDTFDDETEDIKEANIIRDIPNDEVDLIRPPKGFDHTWFPEITTQLKKSIKWFILANSVRIVREQKQPWSTMMIHTSQNVEPHARTRKAVADYIDTLRSISDQQIHLEFNELYKDEIEKASRLYSGTHVTWDQVINHIPETIESLSIIIDNSRSQERLNYSPSEKPKPVIVVGGNTLSRGLTLEGLVSSFFIRTASAYDTLLQMGRWFGYRPRYGDLQRIWLANEAPYNLKTWFRDLAFVEEEVRQQIRRFSAERVSPQEIGVRIRKIPGMQITAASKMRDAVPATKSFSGDTAQTILFEADSQKIKANLENLEVFATDLQSKFQHAESRPNLYKSVTSESVIKFLKKYEFPIGSAKLQRGFITKYIEDLNEVGELTSWNVVFHDSNDANARRVDVGGGLSVGVAIRSQLATNQDPFRYDIKALIGAGDILDDEPPLKAEVIRKEGSLTKLGAISKRRESALTNSTPLLGIYLIDKVSAPASKNSALRKPINASDDLVGLYFVFPQSNSDDAGDFMIAPNLEPDSPIEEIDNETEEGIDSVDFD